MISMNGLSRLLSIAWLTSLLSCASSHVLKGDDSVEDKRTIATIIQGETWRVKSCYEQYGAEKYQGPVIAHFKVYPSGNVGRAFIEGELPIGLEDCIVEALQNFDFPAVRSGKSVDIKQPFYLRPKA